MRLIKTFTSLGLLLSSFGAFAGGGCDWTLKDTTTTQYGSDSLKVERFDCVYPRDPSLYMDHPRYVGTLYTEGKKPIELDGWWNGVKPMNLDLDLKGFRAILLTQQGTSNTYREIQIFNDQWEKIGKVIDPTGHWNKQGTKVVIPGFYKEDGRLLIDKSEPDGLAKCNACQDYYTSVYELTDTGLVYLRDKEPKFKRTPEEQAEYESKLIYSREEYRLRTKLKKDLERSDHQAVIKEWINDYDKLDPKFKNTVYMGKLKLDRWEMASRALDGDDPKDPVKSYEMTYGDLYGLNKGFWWNLCGKYADERLSTVIIDNYWAGGKHGQGSKTETDGYRAGMVYWYVRSQMLDCK